MKVITVSAVGDMYFFSEEDQMEHQVLLGGGEKEWSGTFGYYGEDGYAEGG